MDLSRPPGSAESPAAAPGGARPDPGIHVLREARLRRHLRLEDQHASRALAAAGVDAVKWTLLEELRDKYLADAQDPPPECLGPYCYRVVSGPDGGLLAYVRSPVEHHPSAAPEGELQPDGAGGSWQSGGTRGAGREKLKRGKINDGEPDPRGGADVGNGAGRVDAADGTGAGPGSSSGQARGQQGEGHQRSHSAWAAEEVVLDREAVALDVRVAAQMTGLRLGDTVAALKLCPQHRLLAYSLPVLHRHDVFCVLVRDTASGRLLLPGGVVGGVAGPAGMELAADGQSLLVLTADQSGRPDKVVLHNLLCGAPPRVLLTETDPRFFLALGRTKDWALLLINSNSKTCSEVHILDATEPGSAPPRLVQPRTPGLEYFVEHHNPSRDLHLRPLPLAGGVTPQPPQRLQPPPQQPSQQQQQQKHVGDSAAAVDGRAGGCGGCGEAEGQLIILTNADLGATERSRRGGDGGSDGGSASGRELTVVWTPLSRPGLQHWRPLLPERPGVVVTDMDMFATCVVLYERRLGLPSVSVLPLPASSPPPPLTSAYPGARDTGPVGRASPQEPVQVPLPPWVLHVSPGANADPLSPTLRLAVSGPLHPPAVLDYHLHTGRLQLLSREEPPPAARDLLRSCSLVQLMVESPAAAPQAAAAAAASSATGSAGDAVLVPVTLILPPRVRFPAAVVSEAGDGGAGGRVGASVVEMGVHNVAPSRSGSAGGAAEPRFTWRLISAAGQYDAQMYDGSLAGTDKSQGEVTTEVLRMVTASGCMSDSSSSGGGGSGGSGRDDSRAGGSGPRPLLLSVYGAYGLPLDLQYDPALLCLLSRGWAVAKVHVRGGGELGRGWHAAGCRHRKRLAVQDCLAALRALTAVPSGGGEVPLTAPGLVAGHAISAGGVVLGAALNADPRVFGAAVLRCAFMELLGSCSDASQPLTAHEWDEWGDPADPRDWAALAALCPYHNIDRRVEGSAAGKVGGGGVHGAWRAAVLASCSAEDPRVHPSIPAKWVARLRDRLRRTESQHVMTDVWERDADDGDSNGGGASPNRSSLWRALMDSLWTGFPRGTSNPGGDLGGAQGPVDGAAVACRIGAEELAGCNSGPGSSALRGADLGGSSDHRDAKAAVCAPLLRVHMDGGGHVREGHAAQAEEVAEEMAFLLVALGGGADRAAGGGDGGSTGSSVGGPA